jgi:CHAT domain-containing protein
MKSGWKWLLIFWVFCSVGLAQAGVSQMLLLPAPVKEAFAKDPEIAESIRTAMSLWSEEKWSAAVQHWELIFSRTSQQYGEGHPFTEISAGYLGDSLRGNYQFKRALPLLERAVASSRRLLGNDDLFTALALDGLAATHRAMGNPKLSLPLAQQALEIKSRILGENHREVAKSIGYLCINYLDLGAKKEALDLAKREVSTLVALGMVNSREYAKALSHLAGAYVWEDRLTEALEIYSHSLSIYEETIGIEHPEATLSLVKLAQTQHSLALYDKALPLLKRALGILERVHGQTGPDTSNGLIALASMYIAIGQFELALPLQLRALDIDEKIFGTEHPRIASDISQIAISLTFFDRLNEALFWERRALSIYEKVYGSRHPSTAASLNALARTYVQLRQFDQALSLQHRALKINEEILGPQNSATAESLNDMAYSYAALGRFDQALIMGQSALRINQELFGGEHPRTLISLAYLGKTFEEMGNEDLAISLLKASVNGFQGQRYKVSRIGDDESYSYTNLASPIYHWLAKLLSNQGRLLEAQTVLDMLKQSEYFEFTSRSELADSRQTRIGYTGIENDWMVRYRHVSDRLAALGAEMQVLKKLEKTGLSAEQKNRMRVLNDDLLTAQKAFNSFLNEMRKKFVSSGPARSVDLVELNSSTGGEMQSLIRGLGSDVVLLQYYVTDDQVSMLLTTSGVQLARHTKIKSTELNRQIAEFRRLLRDPKSNVLPVSKALYQLLVDPVMQDLEHAGAKTVMLSLDGALRYLPFGALHDGQGYLAQRWNLPIYTSVTKSRLQDAVTPKWQAAGLGLTKALGEFAALPAVKAEMKSIVKNGDDGVMPGEVHLDAAFTAARLKDVSQRSFQLLHVASHFRFSPGTEVNSFLLLGDGQHLTLGDIRTQNLRFDNVDMLTLSACDTGLGGGRDAQGREIEGFGVIAQQQGAKAVLATLWPVADSSTADLMADMYRRRQTLGINKAEALRQAQVAMLHGKYSHPFYWAPFILMGNWK